MFWAWPIHSEADAGEIPHVPHRGAARVSHQWNGGDKHAFSDNETLRPFSILYQWHLIVYYHSSMCLCVCIHVCLCVRVYV